MRFDHVAFISYPQHPHVGPTLPVVSTLVRRGYRVSYATAQRFAYRVEKAGAEVVSTSMPIFSSDVWRNCRTEDYNGLFFTLTRQYLEDIYPFYEANRPALIISDLNAFAGRILARRLSIPSIQISPTFAHDRGTHSQQVKDSQFRALLLNISNQIDVNYERFGIARTSEAIFYREKLNIYLFPRALQPCADAMDASCLFAGRCAGEQPHYGHWLPNRNDTRPLALVATSTHYVRGPDYFRKWIEAFSGLGWRVVLSIGESADPVSFGPLPPGFEILQNTSHVTVLPFASLFVGLGGIVTAAECAYHGVPQLLTSQEIPEQIWEAENMVELGLAVHLRELDPPVDMLRRAILDISRNQDIARRVEQVRHIVRRDPGAEEVANRIEDHLASYGQSESCAAQLETIAARAHTDCN